MLVRNFLLLNLTIAIFIWLLSILGLFQLPEGILYDRYVTLTPEISRSTSRILLINCNLSDKYRRDETWLRLITILNEFEPLRIAFTFLPLPASGEFYRRSIEDGKVIFGIEAIRNRQRPDTIELEPLPDTVQGLKFGIINLPRAFYGIYRYAQNSFALNNMVFPSLEAAVMKDINHDIKLPDSFLINFNGKFNGLPNIDLDDVMSGKLIPELVKDRVVLVGFKSSESMPSLHTPLALKGILLSPLEFYGYALDTLISGNTIKTTHSLMKLIILLSMVILYLTISQIFRIRLSLILSYSILLLIFYLVACYVLFSFINIWIPIVEILTLHVITSVTLITRKAMMEEEGLRKMLLETTIKLEKRLLPESFYNTEDHWSQLITFVSQSLELNRAIFLEKVEGEHRVREVKALNCSLEDIYERRRDYEREPYSTAILENGPVEIEKRSFFKNIREGEREYIAPLIFVNRVLGFWALSIDRSKVQDIPAFLSMVRDYALQISELLYFRQQQQIRLKRESWWRKFLRFEGTKLFYRELWENLSVFETRLLLLEKVLERMNTATILYDLFGRVIYINKQMTDILGSIDIRPYEMSALDLGVKLTGIEPEKVRGFLQRIILERDEVSLSVTMPSDINKMYMLYMRPIVYEGGEMPAIGVYPFMIMGIIFVLVDVSYLRSLEIFKNDLFTDLDYRLRNHIEAINLAATLLSQESLPEKQKQMALQILTEKVDTTNEFIKDMKEHLLKDIFVSDLEHYPVDIKGPLLSAINDVSDIASKRGIRIDVVVPELAGFVYASPRLKDVIVEIMKVILHDAIDNSEINVRLQEGEEIFELSISNKGIGLPQEILNKYLFSYTDETRSAELKALKAAIKQVRQWEGDIMVNSDVGKGMAFTVQLKRVK
jgi:CHASE2 domain-containing sensor protein/signal transduction histidine kinase